MEDILIKNGQVMLFEKTDVILTKMDILISDGKIKKLEKCINEKDNKKHIIDATGKCIMPGLINMHTHLGMSVFRETSEGVGLQDWLSKIIWPAEDKLKADDVYYSTMLSYIEQISTGTTCTNDHYFFSDAIMRATEDSKSRAVLTRVLMDVDGNGETRLAQFKEFYDSRDNKNSLITYAIAPHGLYTCTNEYLEKIHQLQLKYNLPIHMHFLENSNEIQDIFKLNQKSAIELLKKYFYNDKLILAHGVKIEEKDIDELKKMDVTIVHNPVSNMRLGCKIADITKYKMLGINVALGTDGQGSGSNLDMFETMRLACLLQGGIHENEYKINAKEVIKMATINAAKGLGLDEKIGSIEIAKCADIILVDISPKVDNITILPNNDTISNIVYNLSGKNVDTTIVNGEILMENRKIKHIDVEEIIKQCNEMAKKIIK